MKTIFSVGFLLILAIVVRFLVLFVLNLAGMPGALISGPRTDHLTARYMFGSLVATAFQSFVYLAYVAFVINWVLLGIQHQNLASLVMWPVAFIAVMVPIWWNYIAAITETREHRVSPNANIEGLGLSSVVAFVAFFVFIFFPVTFRAVYGWVPYIN